MKVAIPSEIKNNEFRVAITPAGVHDLVAHGHDVVVQAGAGVGSSIPDGEYAEAGATIAPDAATTWASAELLLKVKEPIAAEYGYLREDWVIITANAITAVLCMAILVMKLRNDVFGRVSR